MDCIRAFKALSSLFQSSSTGRGGAKPVEAAARAVGQVQLRHHLPLRQGLPEALEDLRAEAVPAQVQLLDLDVRTKNI